MVLLRAIFAERILRMERMLIVLQRANSAIPFPASSLRPRPNSSTRKAGEKSLWRGKGEPPSNPALRHESEREDSGLQLKWVLLLIFLRKTLA